MLMAAFGDVHGNLPALEAVLAALDEEGIQAMVNVGDIVVGLGFDNEAVNLIRQRSIQSVQGEMDRLACLYGRKVQGLTRRLSPDEIRQVQRAYERTRSENLEFLRSLPRRLELTVDGIRVLVCHAGPAGHQQALREDDSDERFRRQREIAHADIVVSGHTHHAFVRWVDDTLFVNPGSVGISVAKGQAVASYAVISTEQEPWSVELRRIPYKTLTTSP